MKGQRELIAEVVEQEMHDLIDFAWAQYETALAEGDEDLAELWENEAMNVISKLPSYNNVLQLVTK